MNRFVLLAIISAVAMASSGVIARFSGIAPAELTFYRLFFGALCLSPLLLLNNQWRGLWHRLSPRVLLNGCLLASFMLSFLTAIQTISLANAIMLVYLAPALASLAAHLLFRESLDLKSTTLIGLSFLGFAMLQQFSLNLLASKASISGLIYGLISLLTYSGFLLANRHEEAGYSTLQRTVLQLLVGACCILPFLPALPWPEPDQWVYAILAGVLPGAVAIYCAIVALTNLPTRVYGTLAYLEPVAVIIAGWAFFAEHLDLLQLSGVLLILSAGLLQSILHQRDQSSKNITHLAGAQ